MKRVALSFVSGLAWGLFAAAVGLFIAGHAMAAPITSYPMAAALSGPETMIGNQGASTVQISASQIKTFVGSGVCGSTGQVQFNAASACGASANVAITGVSGQASTLGLVDIAAAPNAGNASTNAYGSAFEVTNQTGLTTSVGFSNLDDVQYLLAGMYGYGYYSSGSPVTQAKSNWAVENAAVDVHGEGQDLAHQLTQTCQAAFADCAAHSYITYFNGGNEAGNEGQSTGLDKLIQQPWIPTATISALPTPATLNTTITQSITASNVDQTFTVASTTGCAASVGKYVTINYQAPSSYPTMQAMKVDGCGSGTVTGIITLNLNAGATITPAQVVTLSTPVNGYQSGWGQDHDLVDTTASAYSTGTVAINANGYTLNGSGTTWTCGMVGGDCNFLGVVELNADTWGPGGPNTVTYTSYYEATNRVDNTHIDTFKADLAGSRALNTNCVSSCTYKILPANRIMLVGDGVSLPANQVVLAATNSEMTAGDTVIQPTTPWPDSFAQQYSISGWYFGGTWRGGIDVRNGGAMQISAGYTCDAAGYFVQSGVTWPFSQCINIFNSQYGIVQSGGMYALSAGSLTGNGTGIYLGNQTGSNTGTGISVLGWGTGINISSTQAGGYDLVLQDTKNGCLGTDSSGNVIANATTCLLITSWTTGATANAFGGSNCPAVTCTGPTLWLKTKDSFNNVGYIPVYR